MKLHIFNPEHDLVLAAEEAFGHYTPPRAAMALRRDLGFLPAFWASMGDAVLVDDGEKARRASAPFTAYFLQPLFITDDQLKKLVQEGVTDWEVCPWGWDSLVRDRLKRAGLPSSILPSDEELARIRRLSHRATTIPLLHEMVSDLQQTVGERWVAHSMEEVEAFLSREGALVLKAPWSSTGRGVRFVEGPLSPSELGFVGNTLAVQGGIVVEPHYDRVLDFAMEYDICADGGTRYAGLSLFDTDGTGYVGGVLADEEEKMRIVGGYLPQGLLETVKSRIGGWLQQTMGCYVGPVGIDMMVVRIADGYRLHPCVEMNVRRTMGHAAIAIARRIGGGHSRMAIHYKNGNYQLKII